MPVATSVPPLKNIWVAAGEGDLRRVQDLIENEALSPNVPDPYTYTPMHAAASYGHIHVLEYLVSKGGDVNVKDGDDETPLFIVESVDVARWLVEHGASVGCRNQEGITPAQYLAEEFPAVSAFLHSLDPSSPPPSSVPPPQPSTFHTDLAASQLTQSILTDAHAIMQRAEAEGRDPDADLQEMVGRAVLGGIVTGATWAQDGMTGNGADHVHQRAEEHEDVRDSKRPRFDEAGR